MNHSGVFLKPNKEKPIKNRHHWIFSGAVAKYPDFKDGEILKVYSHKNELLGSGYFNRKSNIVGRMVTFDESPPLSAIEHHLNLAISLRKNLFANHSTNAYRLINGEGDYLPGLIVDKYDNDLVIQLSTMGMDKLRPWLVEYFIRSLSPRSIYEKSDLACRKDEGLPPTIGTLFGPNIEKVQIIENGLMFQVAIQKGQKTGFFFDQREMRQWVGQLALKKRVLNCFCYTGGFSVYAAAGGAITVDSVDISAPAIEMSQQNMSINGFQKESHHYYAHDVFDFLRTRPLDYDLVILDPPAFAKRKKDIIPACRGYKDINRLAMEKMPSSSLLLSSSCSYHIDSQLFQKVLFQAALEAGRTARIIGTHKMGLDHPINICHPEGDYLKSFLLYLD